MAMKSKFSSVLLGLGMAFGYVCLLLAPASHVSYLRSTYEADTDLFPQIRWLAKKDRANPAAGTDVHAAARFGGACII